MANGNVVVVVVDPYVTLLDLPRTTTLSIAGVPHTIIQRSPVVP